MMFAFCCFSRFSSHVFQKKKKKRIELNVFYTRETDGLGFRGIGLDFSSMTRVLELEKWVRAIGR